MKDASQSIDGAYWTVTDGVGCRGGEDGSIQMLRRSRRSLSVPSRAAGLPPLLQTILECGRLSRRDMGRATPAHHRAPRAVAGGILLGARGPKSGTAVAHWWRHRS